MCWSVARVVSSLSGQAAPSCACQRPEVHFVVLKEGSPGSPTRWFPGRDDPLGQMVSWGREGRVQQGGPGGCRTGRALSSPEATSLLSDAMPPPGDHAYVFQKQSNGPGSVQCEDRACFTCRASVWGHCRPARNVPRGWSPGPFDPPPRPNPNPSHSRALSS